MNNRVFRKITSIALMTVMIAGGLTFATLGVESSHAATIPSNPHLRVSAEGLNANNEIGPTNIVEVAIIDNMNSETGDAMPRVTVYGETLTLYQNSGGWYGYFADRGIASTGLVVGADGNNLTDAAAIQTAVNSLVASNPGNTGTDGVLGSGDIPGVLLLDLADNFDVMYERPGGAETVSLAFDDPEETISLDRSLYSENTDVFITINDLALNVDPTSTNVWYFDSTQMLYETVSDGAATNRTVTLDTSFDLSDPDGLLICGASSLGCSSDRDLLPAVFKETERNSSTFTNTDTDNRATLMTHDDIPRARQAIVTYGDDEIGLISGFIDGVLSVDSAASTDNTWPSGVPIPITLVDNDLNTNSKTEQTIDITGIDRFIPTVKVGEPFTLSHTDINDADVRIIVFDSSVEGSQLPDLSTHHPITSDLRFGANFSTVAITSEYLDTSDSNPFTFTISDVDVLAAIPEDRVPPAILAANPTALVTAGLIEEQQAPFLINAHHNVDHSDRLQIDPFAKFYQKFNARNNPPVEGLLERLDFTDADAIAIRIHLDTDVASLQENMHKPSNDATVGFVGTNMLNYDFTALTRNTNTNLHSIQFVTSECSQANPLCESHAYLLTEHEPKNKDVIILSRIGTDPGEPEIVSPGLQRFFDERDEKHDHDLTIRVTLAADEGETVTLPFDQKTPVIMDIITFGMDHLEEPVNNAIYRATLEEDGDDSDTFKGTVEYIRLNQHNVLEESTYESAVFTDKDLVIVLGEEDSITVNYEDETSLGSFETRSVLIDTPTYSGSVSLDAETYSVGDTVTVTLEDGDLNGDSSLTDIYTTVADRTIKTYSTVGSSGLAGLIPEAVNVPAFGTILDVSIGGVSWVNDACSPAGGSSNLVNSGFALVETASDSGVFTGTFTIPNEYCDANGDAVSVTGSDVSVEYVDFTDDSGVSVSVGASAGIRASTGSVSFDRTVYPVPFGSDEDSTSNFPVADTVLSNGDLIVYVTVTDSDFDVSGSGEDSIALDDAPVTVTISRGSDSIDVTAIGDADSPITEITPDAGVFESSITISYDDGPDGKILQGDVLQVEYRDPTDASGEPNTVTDSATFDLRNGVLQSDKSVYIIGSDMILTLIEPDFDLDSSQNETYNLDLIEWDSDAATVTMGRAGGEIDSFDPEPFSLRETGPNSGIFQVVIEIPSELEGNTLERGEEIELTYVDWGPSGSKYVGDNDEDISLTIFTSNFGASVELDQKIYSWTDKVYITIVAPDHNFDSQLIDEIGGANEEDELRISTRGDNISGYRLVETGSDTGIFTGEVILVGENHAALEYYPEDVTRADPTGPTDGYLETKHGDGISISYEFSGDETVLTSSLIRWNIGEVQWLEASYPASGNGILRIIDPDMSLNPEAVDNFSVDVVSSTDAGGISLTVTETNEATGIFEGTVFFTTATASSGHKLRISEGDTVTALYEDVTLPDPYTTADSIDITATTLIGTVVPPLERAPASDLRVVDSFGNSLNTVSPDQQVQVSANLANGQDRDQDFAYLVQIQNSDGVTVALAWISGSLSPGQSFSPAVSWIPTESDTYSVTAFVWESVDNPTALSPPVTIDVNVS